MNTIQHTLWAMEPVALKRLIEIMKNDPEGADATEECRPEARMPGMSTIEGNVAVIPIMEPVTRRGSFHTISMERLGQEISMAANNDQVRAILLKIDSPGGTVDGIHELSDVINSAKMRKPIVSHVEGLAASGAYWIASQTKEIIAGQGNLVGSIGVFIHMFDFNQMLETEGIKSILITTGEFKGMGSFGEEITARHIEYLQGIVDSHFADFNKAIAKGRHMNKGALAQVNDGRVFLSHDAKGLGLIDKIGKFSDTLARLQSTGKVRQARAIRAQLGISQ